jgi:DHA2 family multidrug resistance protein
VSSRPYPEPLARLLITASLMAASTMVAVDMTIANVALPHMQAEMSASQDQITWVLTSYLIAGAIATPLSGWLADRYGRRVLVIASVTGFTLASLLCGVSNSLPMIVIARLIQGACGAGLVPMAQATLLDINPPHKQASAMAVFSLGSMLGPLIGPTLGGWLTDSLSWRWVFFINLPFGVLALAGMIISNYDSREAGTRRFDMFGFAALSIGLAAFQLMLDRGEQKDWFESPEICAYAAVLALSIWTTLIHSVTARNTFVKLDLFADRNFAIGSILSIGVGVVAFATVPMMVVMQQNLLGFSALHTGMIGLPRGVGSLAAIMIVTRIINVVDTRMIMAAGTAITASALLMYAHTDLYVDDRTLIVIGFIQGFGGGFIFLPLSLTVFSTLSPRLRNEGTAMYALTRNLGQSLGISFLQSRLIHLTAVSHVALTQGVRPDNPIVSYARPDFDMGSAASVAQITAEIGRQANMVGTVQVFQLVFVAGVAMLPLIFLMKSGGRRASHADLPPME